MLEKTPCMVVAIALDNRIARRLWAMMTNLSNHEIQITT